MHITTSERVSELTKNSENIEGHWSNTFLLPEAVH